MRKKYFIETNIDIKTKNSIHILLLDDDRTILDALKKKIEAVGYSCITTDNPSEAVNIISNQKIDLFIVDYFLIGCTGIDVVNKIRQFSKVYTILLTGFVTNMPYEIALGNYDIDSYSEKSADLKDLLMKIEIGAKSIIKNNIKNGLTFEERLRYLRELNGKTRDDVAQYLGVAKGTIGAYETGTARPDFEKLRMLVKYFNISFDSLLSD
ncbi:MAG: response regulator [Clostridia bacterium]|nr:response regulator [Clostridia bacterium]